jgi:hypothetical protein
LKKEEYNVQDLQGTENEKRKKTSCVAETRAVLVDHEVRQEKREEILIPDHSCAQASLAIGSRTAVEG